MIKVRLGVGEWERIKIMMLMMCQICRVEVDKEVGRSRDGGQVVRLLGVGGGEAQS